MRQEGDKRDLRDPEAIGAGIISLMTDGKLPVLRAADMVEHRYIPIVNRNPSCIERYGFPGPAEPVYAWIRVA